MIESDLLLAAKTWQTALAGLIVALLMGFRWWFSAKREIRQDEASDFNHVAYRELIKVLQAENDRLRQEIVRAETMRLIQSQYTQRVISICVAHGVEIPSDHKSWMEPDKPDKGT